MTAATPQEALAAARSRHRSVMLNEVVAAIAPRAGGVYLDGTLGAGGYARALLEAADCTVIGVDRDPAARALVSAYAPLYGGRLRVTAGVFGALDGAARAVGFDSVDGVMLDIGVSSMQIDEAERGFSFMRDGPLDMRMAQDGESAEDIVNGADESALADIFFHYGEERKARAVARAVVKARQAARITTTAQLSKIIESVFPPNHPGKIHSATRSFQGLRIAVNDELGELERGLAAAERALAPGGVLAVVTFHSLEDRIVKRFFTDRSGATPNPSRYVPAAQPPQPTFTMLTRRAVEPTDEEVWSNPRARSAKLRAGRREDAPARGD